MERSRTNEENLARAFLAIVVRLATNASASAAGGWSDGVGASRQAANSFSQ
jgi:hypothetical protein